MGYLASIALLSSQIYMSSPNTFTVSASNHNCHFHFLEQNMSEKSLYDRAWEIVSRNESLYDRWESHIAAYIGKRWPDGYALGQSESGSDTPTVMEVADMGASEIGDHDAFLRDLYEVFRTLAKGCQLSVDGDWC
jgi:hypothetical protein